MKKRSRCLTNKSSARWSRPERARGELLQVNGEAFYRAVPLRFFPLGLYILRRAFSI